MSELVSAELWRRLRELAKNAKRKHAAIAYVTDDRYVIFGKGDVLVTDASDGAIKSGQTSVEVLKAALEREAMIFSIPGLHAKVYVFDDHVIIGSANLSKASEQLTEAALITDQPSTVSASRIFIRKLKEAGEKVDDRFITRISKLPVAKRLSAIAMSKPIGKDNFKPRIWLVGLREIETKPEERRSVEKAEAKAKKFVSDKNSEVEFIRMGRNSRFRREAKEDDLVIRIWTEIGKSKPSWVYRQASILTRDDKTLPNQTEFWVEVTPTSEQTTLTWAQFKKLYSRVGLPGKFTQWPCREIAENHSRALHDLWLDVK